MNSDSTPLPAARSNSSNRHRSRRWVPYAGAVILVALIVAGLWPQPAAVETARATVGRLRATVNEEGKTRIKQRFEVAAPVTGQLRRISLKAGAEVRAGQTVLAVIAPVAPALLDARSRALAEAKRDVAAASLAKAKSGHDFAASELRRFEKLYADKAVAIQQLESVRWQETAAARELAAAESSLRQAQAELADFAANNKDDNLAQCDPVEVKAPVSGQVLRVFQESARVVTAGSPLLELGDPADLEVVIEALSRDGAAVSPGATVELDQWGGSKPLEARVRLVEPAAFTKVSALGVEEQRVNVIADLLTPPEQRRSLGDAFRVEAHIVLWEAERTLKVSAGALFRRGPQWCVFAVVGGRAQLRAVKVGRSSSTETQILDGLKEGEEVVLYPGDRVHDGQRVKPITI